MQENAKWYSRIYNYTARERVKFSFVMLFALIILTFFYPIATVLPSAVQIPVFGLWALMSFRDDKMWGKALRISGINIFMFLVSLVRCVLADQLNMEYYSTLQVVIQRYQFMVFTILFVYVSDLDKTEKRKVFNLAVASIFVTLVFSLYYVFCVDPQAIRNTQRDYLWGVGDFALMYAIAIFSGPLLYLIIEKAKKRERVLKYAILLVTMLLTIVLCNLVTAIVIVGVSVFVTYCVSVRQKLMYIVIGVVAALMYALKTDIAQLLLWIVSKEIFYWSTNNKIIAIANILMGVADRTNIDTIGSRFTLAGYSIKSFVENPIFGINWANHKSGTIGCHMQWADDLGRYGIVGNLLLIPNYFFIARYTSRYNTSQLVHNAMISAWIVFFVLGFLNPNLSGTTLMIIFVVIPTFDALMENDYEKSTSCKSIQQ